MKKILLVSGCSWTNRNFVSDIHLEMDTSWPKWPELLAKKLDMECINLGMSGAGNEYVYNSIADKLLQLDKSRVGLVIAAWSGYERRDWEKYWPSKNLKWTNKHIDDIGNTHYFIRRSLRHYHSFQILCNYYGLPYKQMQMITPFKYLENWKIANKACTHPRKDLVKTFLESPYHDIIEEENFIGWPVLPELAGYFFSDVLVKNKHEISDLDHHPNAIGQQIIADFIYENL